MRFSIRHLFWLGPVTLAIGFALGFLAYARAQPAPEGLPAGERTGAPVAPATPLSHTETGTPVPAGNPRFTELAGQKAALVAQIADLEARMPKPKTREERLAFAAQVIAVMRRVAKHDRAAVAEMLKLWRGMDTDLAGTFVEEFDRETDADVRSNWMMCILACGGPDAAAFALRILSGPGDPADDRIKLASFLNGAERGLIDLGRLPVSGSLLDRAFALSQAASDTDRAAGAGLLGIAGTPAALEALRTAADVDRSLEVRRAALHGLGRSGDEATLTWLEAEFLPRTDSLEAELKAGSQFAAQEAIAALKKRLKK